MNYLPKHRKDGEFRAFTFATTDNGSLNAVQLYRNKAGYSIEISDIAFSRIA